MTAPSPQAGGGLSELQDEMVALRHSLASVVLGKLSAQIDGLSAHFGEQYEHTDEPEAVVYRRTGGTFRFLAFACSPYRMWDFHVGVVPIGDRTLSIGLHISERAKHVLQRALEAFAVEIGGCVEHVPRAVEYQANLPPFDLRHVERETIEGHLVELCRRMAREAAATPCPTLMRA